MKEKIWDWLTSLKLAIVLATLATLVIMAGSLIMHYHPRLFGDLDGVTLGHWYPQAARQAPLHTAWMPLAAVLLVAFGVNTLCCLIDWLARLRSRWRKTGEYLIHLGFCLLLTAFFWGHLAGYRSAGNLLRVGETQPLKGLAGLSLRLDDFRPVFDETGRRPLDMINHLTLLDGERELTAKQARTNHPLMHQGLVVVPASFGQEATGFRFALPHQGVVSLEKDARINLAEGKILTVLEFLPAARRVGNRVLPMGGGLTNPALHLHLGRGEETLWQGWYVLREGLPAELATQVGAMRPTEPVYRIYSILTINYDPGARMALVGGLAMCAGVSLCLFSYYAKRRRQDRPDIA
ncbi:cytochrome c biogenesis protein ResB [Geoalkalibacter sp.]|uniref:cytochrome c biogenesis protein ResB n=1 Tax=Geoalkalibacter sp. TaxID=3041440 RepID=UPI00272E8BA2|nr:cytochrome c biogenesis protein ResB [Geoalkalibacter sp.]